MQSETIDLVPESALLKQFNKPAHFAAFRKSAEVLLKQRAFPSIKQEDWKYTRLNTLLKQKFTVATPQSVSIADYILSEANDRIVFVDGVYRQEYSKTGNQLKIAFVMDAEDETVFTLEKNANYFDVLNAVYFSEGLSIAVNATSEKITEIIFIQTTDCISQIRNTIQVQKNSEATLYFSCFSLGKPSSFLNLVTEINIAEEGRLTINLLQNESENATQINTINANQDKNATLTINTIALTGKLIRNNLNVSSNGRHTETNLNGLYTPTGSTLIDNHTCVDHKMPDCNSNELYKGILADQSTAVFNGKVFVRQDAQKINAFQSNANVLLSEEATVNSKPELEIYADDVKCSHGSATGQIDDEAIFYLRARGISEQSARKLMMQAFAGDVLERINDELFKQKIETIIADRFQA